MQVAKKKNMKVWKSQIKNTLCINSKFHNFFKGIKRFNSICIITMEKKIIIKKFKTMEI